MKAVLSHCPRRPGSVSPRGLGRDTDPAPAPARPVQLLLGPDSGDPCSQAAGSGSKPPAWVWSLLSAEGAGSWSRFPPSFRSETSFPGREQSGSAPPPGGGIGECAERCEAGRKPHFSPVSEPSLQGAKRCSGQCWSPPRAWLLQVLHEVLHLGPL